MKVYKIVLSLALMSAVGSGIVLKASEPERKVAAARRYGGSGRFAKESAGIKKAGWVRLLKDRTRWTFDHYFASGEDLSGVDLSNLDLSGAVFIGSDLANVNASNANLEEASLMSADLTNVILVGANLTQADAGGARLTNANLTGANLSRANLEDANLTGANLTGVDLTGARFSARTNAQGVIGLTLEQKCYMQQFYVQNIPWGAGEGPDSCPE